MRQLTFQEVENLLQLYPRLQGLLKSLQIDLQAIEWSRSLESDEAVIYAMATGGRKLDGLPYPPEGNTSDKTASVAMAYRKAMERDRKRTAWEIRYDLDIVNMWLEKIDIALSLLGERERQIVTEFYICGKDYSEIIAEIPMSRSWFFEIKKRAIKQIMPLMKIAVEEFYERAIKLCETKEE